MFSRSSRNQGFILIGALFFVSIMSLVGVSSLSTGIAFLQTTTIEEERAQAFQMAASYIEQNREALTSADFLEGARGYDGLAGTDDDHILRRKEAINDKGSVSVTVQYDGPQLTIKALATTNSNATIEVSESFLSDGVSAVVDAAVHVFGTTTGSLGKNVTFDGRDWDVPADFNCGGSGCDVSDAGTEAALIGMYSSEPVTGLSTHAFTDIMGSSSIVEGGAPRDAAYWQAYYNRVSSYASYVYGSGVHHNIAMGTRASPRITLIKGDATLNSTNIDGAGILIIDGNVSFTGTMHFEGLVVMMNSSSTTTEIKMGGTMDLYGSIVAIGDNIDITANGTTTVKYSYTGIDNLKRIPAGYDRISWQSVAAE